MKNLIYLALLTFGLTASSFSVDERILSQGVWLKIDFPNDVNQSEWSTWRETSCYKGLDFRVKNRGKNYNGTKFNWGVQFRNRYQDRIYFSYEVYDDIPSNPRTTNRTDIRSGEMTDGYRDFYMQNGNSIYVFVDKVRFERDGLQDYYDCDK